MTSSKVVLIDGDSIAYKAGYATSVEEAQVSVNKQIGRILTNCGTNKYELYLEEWRGDKNIFRGYIAETKSYKGNRKGGKLPPNLLSAREHLLNIYHAKVQTKYESEDMCLIRAYEIGIDKVIVAYIDKDLLQYPLTFYNYNKETMVTLTEEEALFNLWAQVLTGDSVDNIPGLRGYGPVKASRALNGFEERDYPIAVAEHYIRNSQSYLYFIEQYNLVKLRNKRDTEVWYPITQEQWDDI
jgi:hypothetical protein